MSTSSLDHARALFVAGYAVGPVPYREKGSVLPGWPDLRLTAADLPRYFNGTLMNIAVLTGLASGGRVDIDVDHECAVALADDHLPTTGAIWGRASKPKSHRMYTSGLGSEQFQAVRMVTGEDGKVSRQTLMIIEIRGDRLQSLAPGSVHPSGEPVRWDAQGEPTAIEPATLRASVVALADAAFEKANLAAEGWTKSWVSAPSTRATPCLSPGSSPPIDHFLAALGSRGLTPKKTAKGWICRCPAHGDKNPSLSISVGVDGRVLLKCFTGCPAENIAGAVGLRMSDLFWSVGDRGVDTTPSRTLPGQVVSAPAKEILVFVPFPTSILPSPIREYVNEGSRAIGCDACYIGLPLLVALASAIGNTRRIRLKRKWSEPAILWGTTIGGSGTTKTPGMDAGLEAVRKTQDDAFRLYSLELKTWEEHNLHYETQMAVWRRKAAMNADAAGDAPREPERPTARRVMTSDTTTEALAPTLLENPRGLLVANDELASWIGAFDRYSGGRVGADAARWLSMHNGGGLLIDRKDKNKPTIAVPEAVVSVIGGIQPGILRRALSQQHRDNGLAARLLLAHPPRRKRVWTEDELSVDAEKGVGRLFDVLYALRGDVGDDGREHARLLTLSPGAKVIWIEFFNVHAEEQIGLPEDLAAAWSKLEAYAPRFALVLHLVRCAAGDPTLKSRDEVDEVSMAAGVTLANWFGGEARRVYAMLDETEDDAVLREIEERVQRLGGVVTPRDLQKTSRQYRTAAEAEAALELLIAAGRGDWEHPAPGPSGGHPIKQFRLRGPALVDTTFLGDSATAGCVGAASLEAVIPPSPETTSALLVPPPPPTPSITVPMYGPPHSCRACRHRRWWSTSGLLEWTCGGCHPPPQLNGAVIHWHGNEGRA